MGKDDSSFALEGFTTTLQFSLTAVFNVMRLTAAAIARTEPLGEGGRGVTGMTLPAARDLSPFGIRVVTIAPGTINTPAYGQSSDQLEAFWGPQVPFPKRMGRATEYGQLALSIIENDDLNGEVIRLDGALRFPPK